MKHFKTQKERLLEELRRSFREEHTPNETALSFAFGVFVSSMPTLGVGILLFAVISRFMDRVNKIAMFASVLALNPFVKPVFYVASINLGAVLVTGGFNFTLEPEKVLLYLVVGNAVIALTLAIIAYFTVLRLVTRYQEPVEEISEALEETVENELH